MRIKTRTLLFWAAKTPHPFFMIKIDQKIIDRFWKKVEKIPPDDCWYWIGCLTRNRGQISINGKVYLAHRVSWMIHYGEIPSGLQINHHCDNPRCSRPSHLFLGTQKENIQDMLRKNRRPPYKFKNICYRGHEKNVTNIRVDKRGGRHCRLCARARRTEKKSSKAMVQT